MKIEVLHSRWGYEDDVYEGGAREIEKPSKALLAGIAAAAAAPDPPLRVVSASKDERAAMEGAVQSQEDGESAYAKAQASGEWQLGNLEDYRARARRALLAHDRSIADGTLDERLSERDVGILEAGLAEADKVQARIDEHGEDYETAVATVKIADAEEQLRLRRAGEQV